MNNVSMGGMNAMGGPVGGGMPMMNNGAAPGVLRQPMPGKADQRAQLNTYIYEYFIRNDMWDCARSMLNSDQPLNVVKRNEGEDGGDDSKDEMDSKRPADLPSPNVPKECPESCFLYEWWSLFWDMFNAQRNKSDTSLAANYVTHTQTVSRERQNQQQAMLRGIKGGDMSTMPPNYQQMMMRNQQNLNMQQTNELRQKAIQNTRNGTPQQQHMHMQMLAKQQQQQQQMQRDPSDGNNQQRAQSPGSAENAPSPSKRPRLDGPFNQQQQMPNGGRGQSQGMPQQVGETGPSNAIQAAHLQLTNGIEPNNLTAQQFQNANSSQARSLAGYQASLSQQQAGQMPGKPGMPGGPGGPQNQGSPMMTGPNDGIAGYYNPDIAANGMRGGAGGGGGPGGQANGTGNHALQDYQMQLMLLEQQNKKRLMMARQEQDNMTTVRPDGPGGPGGPSMGPNGQVFQGASPQGPRSVNSPNPSEQMKRGTPHMNPGGMPSPVPEGQSRGSPSGMNFNLPGGGMDPNMDPKFYQMNGMNPNMVPGGGMPNGMRPPSSHPSGGFNNNPMAQQQMMAARQQQGGQWQSGPNGQMVPQPNQATPQQNMGTPRQGAMPPPSAPAANANTNGRTQPPSPQQGTAAPPTPSQTNKANPKKKGDSKSDKSKRATKKGSAPNLNPGSTPSADAPADGPTPTPATPMTPVHPAATFPKNQSNGTVQPPTNGQATAPVNGGMPVQPDLAFDIGNNMPFDQFQPLGDFTQPGNGSMDVLQDFDFDSFLHQDGDVEDQFNFGDSNFLDDGGQIGAN